MQRICKSPLFLARQIFIPRTRRCFWGILGYLRGISRETRATSRTLRSGSGFTLVLLHASIAYIHPRKAVGRECTPTHGREDNCCGVTRYESNDDDDIDEVAQQSTLASPCPPIFFPPRSPTSMCNNPYRHGWLPLLGLHNRALIDNLYGACRLFDYPPSAGLARLGLARLGSPASFLRLSVLVLFFSASRFFSPVLCPRILIALPIVNPSVNA